MREGVSTDQGKLTGREENIDSPFPLLPVGIDPAQPVDSHSPLIARGFHDLHLACRDTAHHDAGPEVPGESGSGSRRYCRRDRASGSPQHRCPEIRSGVRRTARRRNPPQANRAQRTRGIKGRGIPPPQWRRDARKVEFRVRPRRRPDCPAGARLVPHPGGRGGSRFLRGRLSARLSRRRRAFVSRGDPSCRCHGRRSRTRGCLW